VRIALILLSIAWHKFPRLSQNKYSELSTMAETLGTVASIITVLQLANAIADYVSTLKDATKQQKRLRDELRACSYQLQTLEDKTGDDDGGTDWAKALELLKKPDGPIDMIYSTLTLLKPKLDPKSGGRRVLDVLLWPRNKKDEGIC
jgi:hypothetical protein